MSSPGQKVFSPTPAEMEATGGGEITISMISERLKQAEADELS